jgi:probable F420-dependent oxidoreductase
MSAVRFSVRIPVSSPVTHRDRLLEATRAAEALGYDAIFVQDHIHKSFEKHRSSPPGCGSVELAENTRDPVMFETISTLSYLAAATSTIGLAAGVTPLPLRDPILLAKQIATLDVLSAGRFVFGVGVANVTDKPEFAALGIPFRTYAERYELAAECLSAMRAIWEHPTASYHGTYANFDGLTIYPKPTRRIPVLLGAGSVAGGPDRPPVRFALAHADGVLPPYVTTSQQFEEMVRDFTSVARAAGKDMAEFDWCAQRRFGIGRSEDEALGHVRWMAREQADMWQYAGYMHGQGALGTQMNIKMATVGTPDVVRANIDEFLAAGANHIEVAFIYPHHRSFMDQLRLFADAVIPSYR